MKPRVQELTARRRNSRAGRPCGAAPRNGASARHPTRPSESARSELRDNARFRESTPPFRQIRFGYVTTDMELCLRLHHLASACEPAAETTLNRTIDPATRDPSIHPERLPV